MTARVVKQYSQGLMLQMAYTLSKTIANTAQSNTWVVGPSNALYNANYNRSLEANDVPQRLVFSYIYDLPVGHGKKYLNNGFAGDCLRRLGVQRDLGISERPADPDHRPRPDQPVQFLGDQRPGQPAPQSVAFKRTDAITTGSIPRRLPRPLPLPSQRIRSVSRICDRSGGSIRTSP